MLQGVGKGPQGRGSIIFDHEGAPCIDSRYHRPCGGRWRGVLSRGFGPDGGRRRYKVSGRTKQDVIEALKKKKSEELDAGLSTSRSYTVESAAHDWLEHGLPGRSERPPDQHRPSLRHERRPSPARPEPVRTRVPRAAPRDRLRQPSRHHTRNRAPAQSVTGPRKR